MRHSCAILEHQHLRRGSLPSQQLQHCYPPPLFGWGARNHEEQFLDEETLGWKPQMTLETGIAETVKWYWDNKDKVRK